MIRITPISSTSRISSIRDSSSPSASRCSPSISWNPHQHDASAKQPIASSSNSPLLQGRQLSKSAEKPSLPQKPSQYCWPPPLLASSWITISPLTPLHNLKSRPGAFRMWRIVLFPTWPLLSSAFSSIPWGSFPLEFHASVAPFLPPISTSSRKIIFSSWAQPPFPPFAFLSLVPFSWGRLLKFSFIGSLLPAFPAAPWWPSRAGRTAVDFPLCLKTRKPCWFVWSFWWLHQICSCRDGIWGRASCSFFSLIGSPYLVSCQASRRDLFRAGAFRA